MRATALSALERTGRLDTGRLTAALADPDPRTRRRAAQLAARHPDVDLAGALDDDDPAVVESAAWACGERPSVDDRTLEGLVTTATEHPDALCRESAVAALGALADPRGLPAVLAGCADRPAVRRRAVLALAPFEGPDVEAAVATALTDHDWQVRQAAEDLS